MTRSSRTARQGSRCPAIRLQDLLLHGRALLRVSTTRCGGDLPVQHHSRAAQWKGVIGGSSRLRRAGGRGLARFMSYEGHLR